MKKVLLFTFLVFFIEISCAQIQENSKFNEKKNERYKTAKKRLSAIPDCNGKSQLLTNKLAKKGNQVLNLQTNKVLDTIQNKIVLNEEKQFIYDANAYLISEVIYSWNPISKLLEKDFNIDYTRNTKGSLATSIESIWNGAKNIWENNSKTDYSYNSSSDLITEIYFEWDASLKVWQNISKIEYTYDLSRNQLSDSYWEWDGINYVAFDQFIYTYDTKGNKLSDIYSTYNSTTKKYDPVNQFKNAFSTNYNKDTSTFLIYNASTRKWVNSGRDVYTYDGKSNLLTDNYTEWNATTSKWLDITQTSNTYDSKHNRLTTVDQDFKRGKWVNSYSNQYIYDSGISISQLILPFDDETINLFFKTKHTKAIEFKWNVTLSKWDTTAVTVYNYKSENSSVNKITSNFELVVYPNPAHNKIEVKVKNNFEAMQVEIYSTTGQLVKTIDIKNYESIELEGINKGIYIFQFKNNETIIGHKKIEIN